jgi:hypothetical protein
MTTTAIACTPAQRVTRSLLGYGVIAGPCYLVVSLAQAFTRRGFDPARHEWSLLANGALGWIQIANLILTGLMVIAAAAGIGRAVPSVWAPRLITVYGACLVGAGLFRADPAFGFPVGTPAGPGPVSWHGMLHLVCGAVGFGCLAAACFVLARHLPRQAVLSRVTGVAFLVGFAAVAAGAGAVWSTLSFTAAVILVWAWLSTVSVSLYRSTV